MELAMRMGFDDPVHEVEEFEAPAALVVAGSNLAVGEVEGGKQGRGAVALVMMRLAAERPAVRQPELALGALERLNVRLSSAASSTIRARWRSRYSVLVERAKPSSSARPASVNTIGVASEMPLIHPLNHDSPSSESGTSRGGSARGRIRLARLEGLEARCQLSGCRSVSWPMLAKLLASMAISASSRAFAERMRMPKPRP